MPISKYICDCTATTWSGTSDNTPWLYAHTSQKIAIRFYSFPMMIATMAILIGKEHRSYSNQGGCLSMNWHRIVCPCLHTGVVKSPGSSTLALPPAMHECLNKRLRLHMKPTEIGRLPGECFEPCPRTDNMQGGTQPARSWADSKHLRGARDYRDYQQG
jgi:hypothetical protein